MFISECVAADVADSPQRVLLVADIILRRHPRPCPREWISAALRAWPGSVVAATCDGEAGFMVGTRGETEAVAFLADVPPGRHNWLLPMCAIAAYGRVLTGQRLATVERITIRPSGGPPTDLVRFPANLISLRRADNLKAG